MLLNCQKLYVIGNVNCKKYFRKSLCLEAFWGKLAKNPGDFRMISDGSHVSAAVKLRPQAHFRVGFETYCNTGKAGLSAENWRSN